MSEQLDLTTWAPRGETVQAQDVPRLGKQLQAVLAYLSDEKWHTLADISRATGAGEASASARIRDVRRLPGYRVDRLREEGGLHFYRVRKVVQP